MEQNNQNTSTKDQLQILIESENAPFNAIITIAGDKLKELGISTPTVTGWSYNDGATMPHYARPVLDYRFCDSVQKEIEQILTASMVNNEQRKAVLNLISGAFNQSRGDYTSRVEYQMFNHEKPSSAQGLGGIIIEQF